MHDENTEWEYNEHDDTWYEVTSLLATNTCQGCGEESKEIRKWWLTLSTDLAHDPKVRANEMYLICPDCVKRVEDRVRRGYVLKGDTDKSTPIWIK